SLVGLTETPSQALESPLDRATLTRGQRRWLVAILLVAAVVRVFWALYTAQGEPIDPLGSGDQYYYWYYGQELAAGRGYETPAGDPTAYYPIGYPGFLAALFWVVAHTPIPDNLTVTTNLVQAVLGTASVALVFVIGRSIFDARVGLVGAGIAALFPNVVFYTGAFMVETTFVFLCLVCAAILATHDWATAPPGRTRLLVFGSALGMTALVRPFVFFFLIGLVVAVIVAGGWRRAVVALAWVLLPFVVVITPWTVRNLVVMDSFVVFSTNLGDTVCIDRSEGATGRFRWAAHEGCVSPLLPEVERYRGNTRKAIGWVLDHPDQELTQIVKRAWYMSRYDHDGLLEVESRSGGAFLGHRVRTVLGHIADWYYFVVFALAALGIPAFLRRRRPARLFVVLSWLGLLVIPLGLWGNPRFHIPALPFLALSAAVPLTRWGARIRSSPSPDGQAPALEPVPALTER
ncbi:MAG TPA: glycosyltransferase family 39 protein, partial [Acidimicrobiia bacterium]